MASTRKSAHAQVRGFWEGASRPLLGLLLALAVVLLVACARGSDMGQRMGGRAPDGDDGRGKTAEEETPEALRSAGGETTLGAEGAGAPKDESSRLSSRSQKRSNPTLSRFRRSA